MDIIEYAEEITGVKLNNRQKEILVKLNSMPPDRKILILPPGKDLFYRAILTAYAERASREQLHHAIHRVTQEYDFQKEKEKEKHD